MRVCVLGGRALRGEPMNMANLRAPREPAVASKSGHARAQPIAGKGFGLELSYARRLRPDAQVHALARAQVRCVSVGAICPHHVVTTPHPSALNIVTEEGQYSPTVARF